MNETERQELLQRLKEAQSQEEKRKIIAKLAGTEREVFLWVIVGIVIATAVLALYFPIVTAIMIAIGLFFAFGLIYSFATGSAGSDPGDHPGQDPRG